MSATTVTNPTPVLRKLYRRHRSAQAVYWLAWISTPLLGTAALLHLLSVIWPALQTGIVPVLLACLALLVWIPVYFVNRSSLLRIAREADVALGARGAVTTAAELTMTGGARTEWGQAAVQSGSQILGGADVSKLVPAGRFLPAFAPLVAAIAVAAIAALPVILPAKQLIAEPEPEPPEHIALVPIFNPADEKMLERVQEELRAKLDMLAAEGDDEKAEKLKKKIDKALAKLPEDEESLREFMDEVETIKADMNDLIAQKQAEEEFLEELGESMDAKLLEDLAEALEKGDAGEAAEVAEQMAEAFEEKHPKGSSMTKASEDLLEAMENAQPLLDEMQDGQEGQEGEQGEDGEEGEQSDGQQSEQGEDGENSEGMDPEKLADLLKTLDKLAGALGIKDAESIPEGLKKLGEKLQGLDKSGEQTEKLGELVEGLENLQNLMNGAGQDGKESYKKLREDFEKNAEGQQGQPGQQPGGQQGQQGEGQSQPGQGDQPGQQGQGQPGEGGQPGQGNQPGGQQGQGEGQGEKGDGGQGQGTGDKPGDGKGEGQPGEGQGQGAGDKPGGQTGTGTESGKAGEDGQGDGKKGYGTGATDHLGDTPLAGEDATFEDMQVEGEDNPGPIKKDVIYGAGQDGFVDEDYKKVYEQYNSILQEIMDGEEVPSIYRFYVDKYFQLIAPREDPPAPK